jgi:Holliday junction resolvase-like predicted endonuclease
MPPTVQAYYHSLFLLWLNLPGFDIQAEVATDKGRIDAVWVLENRVVITEIKYSSNGTTASLLENALAQIRTRRYHERFGAEKYHISFLAIAFADKEVSCRMEPATVETNHLTSRLQ